MVEFLEFMITGPGGYIGFVLAIPLAILLLRQIDGDR